MKTRLKHMTKSTVSVLLSLLMIVSTVTVGIIATSAAYTEQDEAVGADTWYAIVDGSWHALSSNQYSETLSVGSHTIRFAKSAGYQQDTYYGANNTTFTSTQSSYNIHEGESAINLTVSTAGSFIFKKLGDPDGGGTLSISVTFPSSGSNNVYLYGYVNGSDVSSDSTTYEFTQSASDSNIYTYEFNSALTSDLYAQINSKGTQYTLSSYTEASDADTYYTLSTGGSAKLGIKQNGKKIVLTWNASEHKLKWNYTSKTVTYGVRTADASYGSVTATKNGTSIGNSPASVANGSSVVFTATPNFGYVFEGWYNDASGGTRQSTSNSYTVTINADTTLYAHFEAATPDPYYLSGRFAIATSSANIHSNTTGASREQYGQTVADGGGIDEKTGSSYYGTWNETAAKTKLKFTLADGSSSTEGQREYYLNTYRTVKQLSEDKDKLYSDYGGDRDDYHDPFYFVIHDKVHRLGGTSASGANFQNNNSEANALSLTEYIGTVAVSNEIRFNNYNSQSNGWVVIHLKENGYDPTSGTGGTPTIWYTIEDETPAAADTVRISVSPTRIDRNSSASTNVTIKGSYVADSLNAPANSITYTFYRSTDGKNWSEIQAKSTSDTCNYKETTAESTIYYKVTVGSNTSYLGSLDYDTRSASTSAEVYASGLYMSTHIAASTTTFAYADDDLSAYTSHDYPYQRSTGSSYTNSNPYEFTLSTVTNWDPDMEKYDIDESSNQFCTIEYSTKDVTINEEAATVVTYKVIPNPKCSNPRIYVDFKNKKIWAIADYSPSSKTNTKDSGETVTYYFAEADYCTAVSDPTSGTGMRIHYWNNSYPSSMNGTTNVTTAVNVAGKDASGNATTNNSIYVRRGSLFGADSQNNDLQRFYVYSVELPIWATSFQFLSSSSTDSFGAQPTYTYSVSDSKDHSITLNPNRIYVLYTYDSKNYVKGVVLDESMWNGTRTNDGNEVDTFKVDTNVVKYTDLSRLNTPYKPNGALSQAYNAYGTPWALYFGYLENSNSSAKTGQSNCTQDYNSWGSTFTNLSKTDPSQWAANLAQRKDGKSYYASVQDLVGMTTSKTQFNTNGDGATFGYLMDTKVNNESTTGSTYGKSTANNQPLFAYEGDGTRGAISSYSVSGDDSHSATSTVVQGAKFPFYKSTLNGITTYSYDSTTDRNRRYDSTNGFYIQGKSDGNGFCSGKDADDHQYAGLFPFGGNTDSKGGCAFGLEYDLTFYMTNTGYLTDSSGIAQDISFNFSGDDDVWVFVDGVKVLDLGGDHKVSAATINFTDGKVYYKSSATSINSSVISSSGCQGTWSYDNNSYINVVDLNEILAAYGKPFNSTDASTKHTFQMFYLERGAFQSNCVISFNLPQASGLNVKNNVTVDNVNEVLKKDTLYATNPDYFTYSVAARLVNSDLPSEISNAAKAPATTTGNLDISLPVYPYGYETKRVFNDGSNPILTYTLSTAGGTSSGSTSHTFGPSNWTNLNGTVYELSDEYLQATTAGKAQVTGKTDSSTGVFHLLGGEMANFNNKITQNSYVRVTQTQGLGTVNNTSPIAYQTVTNNKTGSYYLTSYSVYDEKSKKYIVSKTGLDIDLVNDHYAKDSRLDGTTGANGFYFSNYTGDAEDVNSAMRVDFYNDVAVGTIRIQKELDDNTTSAAKFNFKLKLGRLFGSGSDTLKEYPGLEYKVYYSDGTPIATRYYNATNGITISPGQYADIEGIPVETYYEVEEVASAGYSFVSMTKTATKQNGTAIYYNNVTLPENLYSETVLAPSAPKSTKTAITTEGTGDDAFVIYKNMIPPVEETYAQISGTDTYISLNKLLFVNQREQFTVVFKYYDRDTTNNVPASISNVVSTYSTTLTNLDAYIYNKGDELDSKYSYLSTLAGIGDVADGQFVAYNYEKMIRDKSVEFVENTGTGVSNLIDDYRMWTRQVNAVTGLQSITNLKTGSQYTADEAEYHTTSNGQPNTSGEKWVNYLSSNGTSLNPENPASANADFHAGDLSNYENIKSIVVWLYNTPKEYTVNVYGAMRTDDLQEAANITLKGQNKTIEGARVAKKTSSSKFENVKGYYSQRLGDKKGNDYLDAIAYLSAYDVDACVRQNDDYVCPETKAADAIGDLVFAYWAYDAAGTQVASTDYIYGYRITGDFDIYAVYAPAKLDSNEFGLTIVKDADDTYVDSTGNARIRINTMFNPYNLPDNDSKIKRAAVVNIYVSKLLRAPYNYSESDIKRLCAEYEDQLKAMLAVNSFTSLNLNGGTPSLDVLLTTKGYVKLVNSGANSIDLTNKNRIEFTTVFGKSQLYTDSGTVGILQYGAMAYDSNGDDAVSADEWVLSDNTILRTFSKSS